MNISKNIKAIREHAGLSQSEFANMLDVSDKAVSTWENGRREPRMGVIQKIAGAFDLQISDILDSDLGDYYKTKNSPAPAPAETGEITREMSIELLKALGLLDQSGNLSDDDLAFLAHIIGLLEWRFGNRS